MCHLIDLSTEDALRAFLILLFFRKTLTSWVKFSKLLISHVWVTSLLIQALNRMALGEGSRSDAEDQDWIVLKKVSKFLGVYIIQFAFQNRDRIH